MSNALASQFRSKLERAYADHLFGRKRLCEIGDFKYEALTFRVGFDTRYTPDFLVEPVDAGAVLEAHEVKGPFFREDARVKLYACAAAFPMFRFYLVTRAKDGGWDLKEVRS